jgi:hypothetical protein
MAARARMSAMQDRAEPAITDESFGRFAGVCAQIVGIGGLAYSIAFITLLKADGGDAAATTAAIFLLASSLLATPVLVAVYLRLRPGGPGLALWGLLVGVVAALGTAMHGGFDLANQINPPATSFGDLPNLVDPRGLLTFGLSGLGLAVTAWLIVRSGLLPRNLGFVGAVLAVLLVVIYLGRLIILDPEHLLLLGAAGLAGFIVNPVWWIWLGRELGRPVT